MTLDDYGRAPTLPKAMPPDHARCPFCGRVLPLTKPARLFPAHTYPTKAGPALPCQGIGKAARR